MRWVQMMKRKMIFVKGAAVLLASLFLAACGKADPGQEVPLQSNDDQNHEEIVSQMMADVVTYKSKDGWSVQYHTEQFNMEEDEDSVIFIYKEGTPGANTEEIRYIRGKQPQEVLGELTDTWDTESVEIKRNEGIFPGTSDKWGYWREQDGSDVIRTAVAGEYNGGVLPFYSIESQTDEPISVVSDAISEIVDSITYDKYEPQKEFDYVPGNYVMTITDEIEGQTVSAEYYVQLDDDHTGVISMQDDIDVMWGSYELMRTSPDFEKYEYTIEGESLMLNLDGQWFTFEKQ